jgi:hypothetical protein
MSDDRRVSPSNRRVTLALQRHGTLLFLTVVGVLLLVLSWKVVALGSDATGASIAIMGGGALLAAPFASRLEGSFKVGAIELNIRKQALETVSTAPLQYVDGILPLLESEAVAVERMTLPREYADQTLTSAKLSFIRKEFNAQIIAARIPGDTDWHAGGQLSEMVLPAGTILLAVGPRESLRRLRGRLSV